MPLSRIILLTSTHFAEQLAPCLRQYNERLQIGIAQSLEDLRGLTETWPDGTRLISFGSVVVVPADILRAMEYSAYNFHPGPPTYPGWAPFNFAIYDDVPTYGVTAHLMTEEVDAGAIVGLDFFPVPQDSDAKQLIDMAFTGMGRLFQSLAQALATQETPLVPLPIPWGRRKTTKKLFAEHCSIPPDIGPAELSRRVRAFGTGDGHSVPTLMVNGVPFTLAPGQQLHQKGC